MRRLSLLIAVGCRPAPGHPQSSAAWTIPEPPTPATVSGPTTAPEQTSTPTLPAPPDPLEGNADAFYDGALDDAPLAIGLPTRIAFEVQTNVWREVLDATETWSLQAIVDPVGGADVVGFPPTLDLATPSDLRIVEAEVTPWSTGPFRVSLHVASVDGDVGSTTEGPELEVGEPPPLRDVLTYVGPRAGVLGPVEIPVEHLVRPQGRNLVFALRNRTADRCSITFDGVLARADGTTEGLTTEVFGTPFHLEPGADGVGELTAFGVAPVAGETLQLTAFPLDGCGGSTVPHVVDLVVIE